MLVLSTLLLGAWILHAAMQDVDDDDDHGGGMMVPIYTPSS